MSRVLALLLAGALLLSSCSDQEKPAAALPATGQPLAGTVQATEGQATTPAAPNQTPPPQPTTSQPLGQGQRLSANVSDLSAAATDLGARMTDMGLVVDFNADVLFDFDKAELKPAAQPTLEKLSQVVQEYRKSRVAIHGYTDSKGNDAYNLSLSQRRAQAIADWLRQHQPALTPDQLEVTGHGEANPVAPNTTPTGADNPTGRQQNRRVEVVIS